MRPVVLVPVLDGVDVVLDHGVAVVVVAIVLDRVHTLVLEAAVGGEGGVRVGLGAVHDVGARLSLGGLISEIHVIVMTHTLSHRKHTECMAYKLPTRACKI